ncbi:MAG: maleylpyruvate isomerase family mycothiol-dependent enzyme [Acidimicrobiales bacterium]
MIPSADLAGACAAHARLLASLSGLDDAGARVPSNLPGWTRGHVVTHLARNADSFTGMIVAAARGEVVEQYPGGVRQRADDIEAGSGRRAAELVADVERACGQLEQAWADTTDELWRSGAGRSRDARVPLAELPFRRWRETEIHHADLGLDFSWSDWDDAFVTAELERTVEGLPERLAPGQALRLIANDGGPQWDVGTCGDRIEVLADRRRLLAWLLGRLDDPALPAVAPWQREQRP